VSLRAKCRNIGGDVRKARVECIAIYSIYKERVHWHGIYMHAMHVTLRTRLKTFGEITLLRQLFRLLCVVYAFVVRFSHLI
jgi:hypothetical protein